MPDAQREPDANQARGELVRSGDSPRSAHIGNSFKRLPRLTLAAPGLGFGHSRLARLGRAGHAAVVGGWIALTWLALALIAGCFSGASGVEACSAAAAIAGLSALGGLALAGLFRGPAAAMHGMVAGATVRMLLAAGLGVAAHLTVPAWATAGLIVYLLVFYLVGLAIETVLCLARIEQPLRPKAA